MKKYLSIIISFSIILSPLLFTASAANEDTIVLWITQNRSEISTDEQNPIVYFYAEIRNNVSGLTLMNAETHQPIASMLDDGKFHESGDDVNADGVYSCKLQIDNSQSGVLSFYAIYDNIVSNVVTIRIINFNELSVINNEINTLLDNSEYRELPFIKRVQILGELLNKLEKNGTEEFPHLRISTIELLGSNAGIMYSFYYSCGLTRIISLKACDCFCHTIFWWGGDCDLCPLCQYNCYSNSHECDCINKTCHDCGECEICISPTNEHLQIRIVDVDGNAVIELYNPSSKVISTKGLYITNEDDLYEWLMPAIIIREGEFILISGSEDVVTVVLKRCQANFDVSFAGEVQLRVMLRL